MKRAKTERQEQLLRNEEKWTRPLMEAGWTAVPSVILERQQGLGLDAVDLTILLHLASYWWFKENLPHPSKKAIAERMDIDVSTVRKRIARMEADGLIRREPRFGARGGGQQTNLYHFDGLIKEATPFALEAIEDRRSRKKEDAERRTRKRRVQPRLRIVQDED